LARALPWANARCSVDRACQMGLSSQRVSDKDESEDFIQR
jgi:hypothetical protein